MSSKNAPCNKLMKAAAKKIKDATPSSGFRPQTPVEWERAHDALIESGYLMFLHLGHPHEKARALADALFGGNNGLTLLNAALRDVSHD